MHHRRDACEGSTWQWKAAFGKPHGQVWRQTTAFISNSMQFGTQSKANVMERMLQYPPELVFSGECDTLLVYSSTSLFPMYWTLKGKLWDSFRNTVPSPFGSVISICARHRIPVFWLVFGTVWQSGLAAGAWVGQWSAYIADEFPLQSDFSIKVYSVCVLLSPYPLSLSSSSPVFYSAMPRQCGIPRRGGKTGTRGESGGRGGSEPRGISPIAIASPPSPPSEHSEPTLNSSLHTARFKFKSQLNKPLISAIITAIFSEEEEEATSSDEMSKEQSPSHRSRDSQSSLVGAFLNVSASGHEEGQQKELSPQLDNKEMAEKVHGEEMQ